MAAGEKELLYRDPNGAIISVAVTTGAEFSIGERRQIVSGDYGSDPSHASYDIARERLMRLHQSDGQMIERWVGTAFVRLGDRSTIDMVVFGESGDAAWQTRGAGPP